MKRIAAIDTLKGLMLIIIVIDHVGGPLKTYTWESFGFITATEGFVLLSGLLAGIVYRRRSDRHRPLMKNILRRILTLYKYYLLPILAVAFIFKLFPRNIGYGYYWREWMWLFIEHPWQALWKSVILQYQPGYLDVLSMYLIFTLLIPVVIFALKRGWGYWVLAASFGLWFAAQFDIPWLHQLWHGAFDRSAWQVLFVGGMCIGYHHQSAKHRIKYIAPPILAGLLAAALAFFAISHHWLPTPAFITEASIDRIFLGWVRLLDFSVVATLIAWLAIQMPRLFSIKWLTLLGNHSLQVYVYSNLLIYFIQPIHPRLTGWGDIGKVVISLAAAASLWLPALLYEFHLHRSLVDRTLALTQHWRKQHLPVISES